MVDSGIVLFLHVPFEAANISTMLRTSLHRNHICSPKYLIRARLKEAEWICMYNTRSIFPLEISLIGKLSLNFRSSIM